HEYAPEMLISEHVKRGWGVLGNTAPTDMSGHPALTVPAAEIDGLPVGVMLVGRQFDDGGLLRVARTYEQAYGWVPEHPGDPHGRRPDGGLPTRRGRATRSELRSVPGAQPGDRPLLDLRLWSERRRGRAGRTRHQLHRRGGNPGRDRKRRGAPGDPDQPHRRL